MIEEDLKLNNGAFDKIKEIFDKYNIEYIENGFIGYKDGKFVVKNCTIKF